MIKMPTSQHGLDRARPVSSHAAELPMPAGWRDDSFGLCGSTGLAAFANTAYVTGTNHTAGARKQTIKRPARHLGSRST